VPYSSEASSNASVGRDGSTRSAIGPSVAIGFDQNSLQTEKLTGNLQNFAPVGDARDRFMQQGQWLKTD
jgi:hypothetical protein